MNGAIQAMVRFGLGGRRDEAPPADPRGWLLDQLANPDPVVFAGLADTPTALATIVAARALEKQDPVAAALAKLEGTAMHTDAAAQLQAALVAEAPFRERLVWFWSNHFTVSTRRGADTALIGPFIREAIRPNVTARFADMLVAVMRHPAMLLYLDNASSVGPNSVAGLKQHRGLNENLGRESLELHTVTPGSGYTQGDVTAYAAILTGWGVTMIQDKAGNPPGFRFNPRQHQPGAKTLMGRSFPEGEAGGLAALEFLGTHPATYHALATRLAQHFIADAPPPDAVSRIARALADSGGDLGHASAALVAEPAAWHPLTKLRTPLDYTTAVLRAAGPKPSDGAAMLGVLNQLGQPFWSAPLPNGWSDRAADWADPETLLRRADWSYRLAARLADANPDALAQTALGPLIHPATATAVQHAASRRDALTLLFTAPEFMRR